MIRVEAGNAKFDEPDRQEAFRRAAHLLHEGFESVNVWLWGPRNLPLELTIENISGMEHLHLRRP